MKKSFVILLCGLFLSACSEQKSEEATTKTDTKQVEVVEKEKTKQEVTKEEKNRYVNDLLDINDIIVQSLVDFESFIKQTPDSRVRTGSPEMEELLTILSPIQNEAVTTFDAFPLPPSEDLEELYKLEAKYVATAQEFADIVPLVMESRDSATIAQYKEKLQAINTYSGQISDVISSLELQ